MSPDQELEIRLHFLEEAQDYLNTIESVLLGLTATGITFQKMDAVLRAAHSIKGGAAMMGFDTLSGFAHRLEDCFKVLKTQNQAMDLELESLLLQGVDQLRQLRNIYRQGGKIPASCLEPTEQVFEQLHQRLGEPQPEDETLLLSEAAGQDMAVLLFETEVEGTLQRLEAVLASTNQPCLQEEFVIAAQELGGLGQMLQLDAFTQLCTEVEQALTNASTEVAELAIMALETWRRSQALVLIGQTQNLPTELKAAADLHTDSPAAPSEAQPLDLSSLSALDTLPDLDADFDLDLLDLTEIEPEDLGELEAEILDPDPAPEPSPVVSPAVIQPSPANPPPAIAPVAPPAQETQENTVRVPTRQLDQLNDFFGELIIERNALNLHLGRLRQLIGTLGYRVRNLERSNGQLRSTYDKVATQAVIPALSAGKGLSLLNPTTAPGFDGFDSLEMDRYSDLHLLSQEVMETIVQIQEVTGDIELSLGETDQTAAELNRTAKQLQTTVTQARMRPLSDLVSRFPRAIRDLAVQYNKNVQLKIVGGSTLIDRAMLEALHDPLMHLLRNAFDHGIEPPAVRQAAGKPAQGTIEIQASQRGNQTLITIRDDGGGIDLAKIRDRAQRLGLDAEQLDEASPEELLELIFEPGFSTATQVTELSGRGVGMDVVRTNLKQIRGQIKVDTRPGVGTTFTISVPFTLSIIRVLLVEAQGMILAVPSVDVEEMLLLRSEQIVKSTGHPVLSWDGLMVPLVRLDQWLQFRCPHRPRAAEAVPAIDAPTVLLISQGSELTGLQVDRFWGEQEVAIRPVEGPMSLPPGFSGCTILGEGQVVPLVDSTQLLNWIGSQAQSSWPRQSTTLLDQLHDSQTLTSLVDKTSQRQNTILVVDDSINVRRFLALTLEKAGYQVEEAKDGQDAVAKLLGGLSVRAVICDIEMPRLDGYGVLAQIKSNPTFQNLPIAMLTSRSGDKHRRLAMSLGAAAYFSKPYKEQELLQTLAQLIPAPSDQLLSVAR